MFFLMGISSGRKDLTFHQTMVCERCGQYGSYSVFMTYTVLSLFFIPCFRWNRQYYVISSCCKSTYRLDRDKGRRIEKGENVEIRPEDLELLNTGSRGNWYARNDKEGNDARPTADPPWIGRSQPAWKKCSHCGYSTQEDFDFCPKCGHRL